MIELALAAIVIGAVVFDAAMMWRKIPLLLQVPQQLIEESFVTRPSRLRRWFEPIIAFFRDKHYRDLCYACLIGTLRRVRLWLLRLERMTFRALERLQARYESIVPQAGEYWTELRAWKRGGRENNVAPQPVLTAKSPRGEDAPDESSLV